MCTSRGKSLRGLLHHHALIGPYKTQRITTCLDALHDAAVQDRSEQPRFVVVWDNVCFYRAVLVRNRFTNHNQYEVYYTRFTLLAISKNRFFFSLEMVRIWPPTTCPHASSAGNETGLWGHWGKVNSWMDLAHKMRIHLAHPRTCFSAFTVQYTLYFLFIFALFLLKLNLMHRKVQFCNVQNFIFKKWAKTVMEPFPHPRPIWWCVCVDVFYRAVPIIDKLASVVNTRLTLCPAATPNPQCSCAVYTGRIYLPPFPPSLSIAISLERWKKSLCYLPLCYCLCLSFSVLYECTLCVHSRWTLLYR